MSTDIQNNRSQFYGWARIHKNSYSPTWSNSGRSSFEIYLNRGVLMGSASGLNYDFRNGTDFQIWDGYWWISHNPDGTMPAVTFDAYANYDQLGATEVHQQLDTAPRIPRGPRVFYGGQWRNTIAYVYWGNQWRIGIPYVYWGNQWRIGGG